MIKEYNNKISTSRLIGSYMCDLQTTNANIHDGISWTTTIIRPTSFTSIEIYHHSLYPEKFNVFICFGNTWEYSLVVPVEQMSYLMVYKLVRGAMELLGDNYHSMMFNANRQSKLHIDFVGTFERAHDSYKLKY